jgi:hypothetical protein
VIGIGVTLPLEAIPIHSWCRRKPPTPPREAIPKRPAPGGKIGDHPRHRDLHEATVTNSVVAKIENFDTSRVILSCCSA